MNKITKLAKYIKSRDNPLPELKIQNQIANDLHLQRYDCCIDNIKRHTDKITVHIFYEEGCDENDGRAEMHHYRFKK